MEPTTAGGEVAIDEAVAYAIAMHREGEIADAEKLYLRVLEAAPAHADALHFYGVLLHHRDRSDRAIELIERSIALDPTAGRYNNLGNVLVERGRLEDAWRALTASIELEPEDPDVLSNLGTLHKALGRTDEAEASFRRSLAADPRHVGALSNLGALQSRLGRHQEAVECFLRAIELDPDDAETRHRLGFVYYTMGQIDAAAAVFKHWLRQEPGNPIAQHMAAACSGELIPPRAADAYVEQVFDGFAKSFDAKLEQLSYRAPELCVAALARMGIVADQSRAIVDAGCGTGLCGPLLRPYARQLTGVDLSARMLEEAQRRACYDRLYKVELTAFLLDQPGQWDVIVSADTLCYFGVLDTVMQAAAQALRPGGMLAFSVEASTAADAPAGYRIHPHGRYSHARDYVNRMVRSAQLTDVTIEPAVLRYENQQPVHGFVVSARRGA